MKLSRKTRVLIISHFLINPIENAASSSTIRNFLLDKVFNVTQIELPFPDSKDKYLYALTFESGENKKNEKFKAIKKPDWLAYLIHPFICLALMLKSFQSYDICIACENLSFAAAFPLRKIGIIKKLIYYSVDYIEDRFENKLINKIYHWLDRFACENSDFNWVVAKQQIEGRRKNGFQVEKCSPFKVVPIAFRRKDIALLPLEKIDYYNLVFCGTLRDSAGPQLIVRALPLLLKRFPKIKVTFVGSGEAKRELISIAKHLKVIKHVDFHSNVVSHSKLVTILTKGSIGLAPYAPVPGSLSYKSDPGKIKLYLACGLPVITTSIATSGPLIEKNKAGLVIDYKEQDLYKAIIYLLRSRNRYLDFKNAAINLSKKCDADSVLEIAFKRYL